MAGPLPDVWYRRDFPALIEIARNIDAGRHVHFDTLRDALGFSNEETRQALEALQRRGLVTNGLRTEEQGLLVVTEISGAAYTMTGLHPGDDDVAALVAAIESAAERESDPEEKRRLRRIAEGMANASGEVLKLAIAAYLAGRIPS